MNDLHVSQKYLLEIQEYIVDNLDNPNAAKSTLTQITSRIRILQEHAYAGAMLSSIVNVESDYRFLASGNYLIFYRVRGTDIFVDRILYSRRDYIRVLFE